MAQQRQCN